MSRVLKKGDKVRSRVVKFISSNGLGIDNPACTVSGKMNEVEWCGEKMKEVELILPDSSKSFVFEDTIFEG